MQYLDLTAFERGILAILRVGQEEMKDEFGQKGTLIAVSAEVRA